MGKGSTAQKKDMLTAMIDSIVYEKRCFNDHCVGKTEDRDAAFNDHWFVVTTYASRSI